MTPNDEKLYVVVRADISPGYKIVQSCHAVEEHTRSFPRETMTMVVVEIPTEAELVALYNRVRVLAPATIFYEPDIDAYTAFAVSPSPFHTLFRYLPLAGSPPPEEDEPF